jgi:hypothetical protein
MEVSSKETIIILHGTWTVLEPEKSRWCQLSDGSREAEGFIAKLDAALQERGSCGFQKFDPGRIRTMKAESGHHLMRCLPSFICSRRFLANLFKSRRPAGSRESLSSTSAQYRPETRTAASAVAW